MKRTVAVILVIISLIIYTGPFAGAANNVCFTAINNILQPLDDGKMPAIIDNRLYIPSGFFASKSLGIYSLSAADRMILYQQSSKQLVFDTQNNTVYDQDNNQYYITAVKQNGLVYVPVDFVCTYFGLTYDFIQSQPAPVLRFFNITAFIDKQTFVSLNETKMQEYYDAYTQTDVTPEASPDSEELETFENVTVYLSFYDLAPDEFIEVLDMLDLYGYKACFFVTADEIALDAAVLRQASGLGHTVGIRLEEGTAAEYEEASRQLFEAAKIYSRMISAGSDIINEAVQTAEAQGLVLWKPTKSYDSQTNMNYSLASRLSTIESSRIGLNIPCTDKYVSQIASLLGYLSERKYTSGRITETTMPTNAIE